jgi:hypothetical protein
MNSDQNSIKEQGGGEPKPFTPENVGQNNQNQGVPTPPQNLPKKEDTPFGEQNNQENPFQNLNGGFKEEAESPFPPSNQEAPADEGVFPPQPKTPEPQVDEGGVKPIGPEKTVSKEKKGSNKLFIGILIAIIVIGILVAGYLFVLPMFSGDKNPEGNPVTENQENANNEESEQSAENVNNEENEGDEVDVPTVPAGGEEEQENIENNEENEGDEVDEPEEISGIPVDSHKSLFSTPADSVVEKIISPLNLENVKQALKISDTEIALFREMILTDESENIIKAGELLNLLAPTSFAEAKSEFQDDPTIYTYTNDSGTWMGLVLQLKSSADLESIKSEITKIESNTNEVTNFFLTETGQASLWKDGGAGDITSRYLSFGSGNNSFNYGWSGNKLIISTSYQSFKEGVNKL